MPRVDATVTVGLDPGRTFLLSQTYGPLRYRWDPFVVEQHLLDGDVGAAKGVRTWTRSRHRLTMISEYVTYRPPHHVGMRMVRGPWFFKTFSGGWNFAPSPGGGTRATWRYNFTCKPAWVAPLLHRIGTALLGRDIRKRLDAFARACANPEILDMLERAAPQPGNALLDGYSSGSEHDHTS